MDLKKSKLSQRVVRKHAKQKAEEITRQAVERARSTNKALRDKGSDVWSLFRSVASNIGHEPRKMSADDANMIARNFYDYLDKKWPEILQKCGTKAFLCDLAFSGARDSKELYRLTLSPGSDPARRSIRRDAYYFVKMFEAIANLLEVSVGILAFEMLRGTSFECLLPNNGERWNDMAKIQVMLQRIVDDIDREFGLYQLYQRTAQLKISGLENGETDAWPLNGLEWYLFDLDDESNVEKYRVARQAAIDPSQAYYQRNQVFGTRRDAENQPSWWFYGFDTNVLQEESFFYVPHAPLGIVAIWDLPDRAKDAAAYDIAVAREVAKLRDPILGYVDCEPDDDWSEYWKCPLGQLSVKDSGAFPMPHYMWLLIYPHPDGGRLAPVLYQATEEGGAYLLPIDIQVLDMLHDVVWVSKTEQMPLYKRLEQLLLDTDQAGMSSLERSLRRTATWLQHNPILKRAIREEEKKQQLDLRYQSIVKRKF
jgi:hypothetical protein